MYLTERLLLRPFDVEADLNTRVQWMNDPDFYRSIAMQPPKPFMRDGIKKFFESCTSAELPRFVVALRPPDEDLPNRLDPSDNYFIKDGKARYPMIGVLAFNPGPGGVSPTARECYMGIHFAKPSQGMLALDHHNLGPCSRSAGKEYGPEVMRWGMEYLLNTLGMHRCSLHASAQNVYAVRSYEKVGFIYEGKMRKTHLRNGEWQDTIVMGMLEEDWRAKKAEIS